MSRDFTHERFSATAALLMLVLNVWASAIGGSGWISAIDALFFLFAVYGAFFDEV